MKIMQSYCTGMARGFFPEVLWLIYIFPKVLWLIYMYMYYQLSFQQSVPVIPYFTTILYYVNQTSIYKCTFLYHIV